MQPRMHTQVEGTRCVEWLPQALMAAHTAKASSPGQLRQQKLSEPNAGAIALSYLNYFSFSLVSNRIRLLLSMHVGCKSIPG